MILHYRVRGLHCSQEAALIQKKLAGVDGLEAVSFEILDEKMTVELDASGSGGAVERVVRELGMGIEPWAERAAARSWWGHWGQLTVCVLSGAFLLAGMIHEARESDHRWLGMLAHDHGSNEGAQGGEYRRKTEAIPLLLFGLAIGLGAWYTLPKAWRAVRARHLDMNILVLIALISAAALEEYSEAATLAFLFALANLIEFWSLRQAANQVRRIREQAAHEPHHHDHRKGALPLKEAFIDRFTRWYAPTLLALALLVALALPLAGAGRTQWLNISLMILLTACPCALIISAPVTMAAALASAARHGAYVPHGLALEQAAESDAALEGLIGQHQVVLRPENKSRFRFLRRHAARTMFTMRLNVAIAVLAKAVFLILAMLGKASLWMAVASDLGATLAVTLIGLQMLRAQDTEPAGEVQVARIS
jgi:cation transport ATPase